jgi:hypothetical protein
MCMTTSKKMETGTRADEDDAAVGEGGGGDWVDEDEAAVGEGGGDQNQVPNEAFFL